MAGGGLGSEVTVKGGIVCRDQRSCLSARDPARQLSSPRLKGSEVPHSAHLPPRMGSVAIDFTGPFGAGSFQSSTLTCTAGQQVVVDGEPDSVATQHFESSHAGRSAGGLEDHVAGLPRAEF